MGKVIGLLETLGLTWFVPLVRLAAGEAPKAQLKNLAAMIGPPALATLGFLLVWALVARSVTTSIGQLPGPGGVAQAVKDLTAEHHDERTRAAEFYQRQDERRAKWAQEHADEPFKERKYSGKPTYPAQIATSLKTVFTGFVLASLVAIPLGLLCGASPGFYAGINPFIQIFKPVSPLAWLPIVMILVSAVFGSEEGWLPKSFISSAITVALCSLWPTLINTAIGVASVDQDHINVARVLRLNTRQRLAKIIIPSSLPYIFTGLRISLGVGWMVLIASEMLAQNPGLGKFVWDRFQNGSSQTLAQIMVAVFTIGLIGFALDRIMIVFQRLASPGDAAAIR